MTILRVLLALCLFATPALANDFYNASGAPATGGPGSSSQMRSEFSAIDDGFDKLPALTANAGKAVIINGGATGLTVTTGTLTLPGNFALSGAYSATFTVTNTTTVTFPVIGTLSTLAGAESLSNKTIPSPVLLGSVTGTYTLAGTPTITAPAISNPVFSGTATGTYTLAGTPTITAPAISSPTLSGTPVIPDNVFTVGGSSDASKKLAFEVDGFTTATTRTVTVPNKSGTLAMTSDLATTATTSAEGLVELATQAELDAGTASRVPTSDLNRLALGTPQVTTSGTSFNFASIPTGVRRVTIMFTGVSLSGTDEILVQIGPSGGVETSGYVSTSAALTSTPTIGPTGSTAAFVIRMSSAPRIFSGTMVLTLANSSTNLWVSSHTGKLSTTEVVLGGGDKSLAGVLSQLTIKTDGSNTFDAGSINVMYER